MLIFRGVENIANSLGPKFLVPNVPSTMDPESHGIPQLDRQVCGQSLAPGMYETWLDRIIGDKLQAGGNCVCTYVCRSGGGGSVCCGVVVLR